MAACTRYPFGVPLVRVFVCSFILLALRSVSAQINRTVQTYEISNFNSTTTKKLAFYGLAAYDNHGALQLISPPVGSIGQQQAGTRNTGAAVLNQRFWTISSDEFGPHLRASFSTVFDMSMSRGAKYITRGNSSCHEGLSFVVISNSLWSMSVDSIPVPDFCDTKYSRTRNLPSFMTIKFDHRNNEVVLHMQYDEYVYNWHKDTGIVLSPLNGTVVNLTVWIDFNWLRSPIIQVYIVKQGSPKPKNPVWYSSMSDNSSADMLASESAVWHLFFPFGSFSYFGFTGSTEYGTDMLYTISSWTLSVDIIPPYQHWFRRTVDLRRIIISTSASLAVLLIVVVALVIYVCKKKQETDFLGEALRSLPGMPKEFKYAELKKATDNFSDKNKLGQGGFGEVYKGRLPKEQTLVAVKRFLRETDQGGFLAELTIINRLRHRNLVPLLGWSHRNKRLLLVYDYMPNGSLDKHLFNQQDSTALSWSCRYNILVGVASALHYLHNEYDQKVVHRDLKASNIMLDADFDARLGDFGLARAIDNGRTSYIEGEGMPGTWGYMAPECMMTGKATRESDVFGFGAVVLETVCGRRPGTKIGNFPLLVDWVWALYEEGNALHAVDPRLTDEYDVEEAQRLLLLGLACSHPMRVARPKAREIQQIMLKSAAPPIVPLVKPPFVMESWPFDDDDQSGYDITNQVEFPTSEQISLFSGQDRSNRTESTKGGNISMNRELVPVSMFATKNG